MIQLSHFFYPLGLMFVAFGIYTFIDKQKATSYRVFSFIFWVGYGLSFLLRDFLSSFSIGLIVLGLGLVAGLKLLDNAKHDETEEEKRFSAKQAERFGNKLFIPALIVPVVALAGYFLIPYIKINGEFLMEPKNKTLIALCIGIFIAFIVGSLAFRTHPHKSTKGATRTMNLIGWAAILPQTLATLGKVFDQVGMGAQVQEVLSTFLNLDIKLLACVSYTTSLAIFTMIMGNAFAAFPVITAAIAYPILIQQMGGNPAVIGAVGMLSGFCGTLITPMAANFNIVPVALLNLPDKFAVIKAQFPTAIALLIINTAIIYFFAF